jgi:hypothetical protein
MSTVKNKLRSSYLMTEQMQSSPHRGPQNPKSLAFLVVAILLIAGVWILNILGSIPGSWSGIFGAIFTVLGVVLTMIPLLSSSSGKLPAQNTDAPVIIYSPLNHHGHLEGIIHDVNDPRGALIVYVKRYLRGSTINLCSGFSSVDLRVDAASSVVARRIDSHLPFLLRWLGLGNVIFVAEFPTLEPGNYTVYNESREFIAKVTIYAGRVTEIDWR